MACGAGPNGAREGAIERPRRKREVCRCSPTCWLGSRSTNGACLGTMVVTVFWIEKNREERREGAGKLSGEEGWSALVDEKAHTTADPVDATATPQDDGMLPSVCAATAASLTPAARRRALPRSPPARHPRPARATLQPAPARRRTVLFCTGAAETCLHSTRGRR